MPSKNYAKAPDKPLRHLPHIPAGTHRSLGKTAFTSPQTHTYTSHNRRRTIGTAMISPEFNGTPSTEEYRAYLALLLREVFIGTAETVPLYHAAGRILAQDVTARMDVPSFDNSQMDGYALTAEAAGREDRIFTVGREIPAGRPLQRSRSSDDLTYPITDRPRPCPRLRRRYSRRTVRTHRIPRPARILRPPQRKGQTRHRQTRTVRTPPRRRRRHRPGTRTRR